MLPFSYSNRAHPRSTCYAAYPRSTTGGLSRTRWSSSGFFGDYSTRNSGSATNSLSRAYWSKGGACRSTGCTRSLSLSRTGSVLPSTAPTPSS